MLASQHIYIFNFKFTYVQRACARGPPKTLGWYLVEVGRRSWEWRLAKVIKKMTNQYSEQGTIDALDKMLTFFTGRDKNSRFSKERSIKFPFKMNKICHLPLGFFSFLYSSCNLVHSFISTQIRSSL